MSERNVKVVTTDDTGEIYEFEQGGKQHRGIYQFEIKITRLCPASGTLETLTSQIQEKLHVTQQTLIDAGFRVGKKEERPEEPKETMEDLVIRLLENIGVYPQE